MSRVPPRLQVWLLALASLLAIAPAAATASPGFQWPDAPERLEPGVSVEIRWTVPAQRGDFDELELVLSVDGGRSFPIRLTRDLPATTAGILWRVPFLQTRHARLALRTGESGGRESERIRFVSEEFAIELAPGMGREPLFAVRGELATREALKTVPPRDFFGGRLGQPREVISRASDWIPAALPRSPTGPDSITGCEIPAAALAPTIRPPLFPRQRSRSTPIPLRL